MSTIEYTEGQIGLLCQMATIEAIHGTTAVYGSHDTVVTAGPVAVDGDVATTRNTEQCCWCGEEIGWTDRGWYGTRLYGGFECTIGKAAVRAPHKPFAVGEPTAIEIAEIQRLAS